jgi:hypothetical protein
MQKINVKKVRTAASKVTAYLAKLEPLLENPNRRKLENFARGISSLNLTIENEIDNLINQLR